MTTLGPATVRVNRTTPPLPCAECGRSQAHIAHLVGDDGLPLGATVLCRSCHGPEKPRPSFFGAPDTGMRSFPA